MKETSTLQKQVKMIESFCVIDDNEIDIYQVNRVCKKSNLIGRCYSFSDGKEALDHFLDFEASKEKFEGCFPPQIILLDINMPRMNGFQFLEEYSKLPAEKKESQIIMMLTSSDQENDKEKALKYPEVVSYMTKPFTQNYLDTILETIEKN
jgi:CheY-like chemotaxis protein